MISIANTATSTASSSSTVVFVKKALFFLLCSMLIVSSTQAHLLTLRSDPSIRSCKVYNKPSVHQAMDRICEMCHEMFSHEKPNLRADCRSKCFRNEQFRNCLEMFSGVPQPSMSEEKRRV